MSRLKIGEYKMSNKLIKSKSKYDKELEYYKKHSILLEKENIDLKNRNDEILISFAIKNPSEAYDNLSLLIEKTRISKSVYEKLCMKYDDRIKVLDEEIAEADKVKKEYVKKMEAFEKQYQKMLDNLLKK